MIELLFKYFRGETTPEEVRRIGEWLDEDPVENGRQYKTARFIFEGSVLYRRPPILSGFFTWRRIGRYAAGIAAAAMLMIGTGYFIRQRTVDSLSGQLAVLETPAGQRARMVLPDGTQVWLNADTRMEYPAVFAGGERRVRLSGEALFEVVHDAKCPFIVETFASEVEVLGTKFNVLADAGNNLFTTMLLEGRVRVTNLSDQRNVVVLNPDETVNLVDGRLTLASRQDPEALCWMEGQVSFGGLTFDALMSKFEKAFGVKIVVERTTLPETGYTRGKVRVADGIDHALRVLQHSIPFTYEKDELSNTVVIR